jgi:peroxiredoxin family protein
VFAFETTNKICRLAVYSAATLASRYRFYVHLVNEGLVAFRKHVLPRLNDTGIEATYSPPMYLPYVETNLKPRGRGEGTQHLVRLLRKLKSAHSNRFKICACPYVAQL